MSEYGWLIAGGAALTGGLTMFWSYLKSFYQQIASHIIVSCDIRGRLNDAITLHCWKNLKTSPFGFRTYLGWSMYVRPVKRVQLIAMETVGQSTKLYWKGWRPLWITRQKNDEKEAIKLGDSERYYPAGLKVTFIRGMFNPDTFIT